MKYKKIFNTKSHYGRGYRRAIWDLCILGLGIFVLLSFLIEDSKDEYISDSIAQEKDETIIDLGYEKNIVDFQCGTINVRKKILWNNPGGNPSSIKENPELLKQVTECHLFAKNSRNLIKKIQDNNYDFLAEVENYKFESVDGSKRFDHTNFSMTSGSNTFMKEVRLPMGNQRSYTVEVYEYETIRGMTAYAVVYQICGNFGRIYEHHDDSIEKKAETVPIPASIFLFLPGFFFLYLFTR